MKRKIQFLIIILGIGLLHFFFISCKESGELKHENKKSFSIVTMGDMPYFLPEDNLKFENLIRFVNQGDQDFNVFVGDFKSSVTVCSDDLYHKMYGYFGQFKKPLIYTPGDNEWTDCNRNGSNTFMPEERLTFLRKLFFSRSQSLGQEKLELESQSTLPEYKKFVENKYWDHMGVSFATIHVVGSNNNYKPAEDSLSLEFTERSKANLFWLKDVFERAKEQNSLGLVLFVHADMFYNNQPTEGFKTFLQSLKTMLSQYDKPVLLINGDSHRFIVDKPLYKDEEQEKAILNFTRVQVFGEQDMHAVKIIVDPTDANLFEIQQLIIPEK